jgi:hypothetical protein
MTPNHQLNNRDLSICTYGGFGGVLISATCIIQLMVYGTSFWMIYLFYGVLLFAATSFVLLALQKSSSPILLFATTLLSFGIEVVITWNYVFSLVIVLLFMYSVIISTLLYVEEIPKKLKQRRMALIADEAQWVGKL